MAESVMGFFPYVNDLRKAASKLKAMNYGEITVFSPVPINHEIDEVIGEGHNYLKYFTFFGGVLGLMLGTLFALGTAALYVLPRGGRAIFPVTPTLIVSYEATILCGVFATLIGFLLLTRLPSFRKKTYDVKVNVDRFGLLVHAGGARIETVEELLKEFGADEVKRVEE